MFCYIARKAIFPRYTCATIAKYLNKNHATVVYSVKTTKEALETDPKKRAELFHIRKRIFEIVVLEQENDPERRLIEKPIQIKDIPYPEENPTGDPTIDNPEAIF